MDRVVVELAQHRSPLRGPLGAPLAPLAPGGSVGRAGQRRAGRRTCETAPHGPHHRTHHRSARRRLLRRRPVPDLRLDARARPGLLGRRPTSCGASPATTTSSRSRSARTSSSTPTRTRAATGPTSRPTPAIIGLDDPLHTQAPQPGVAPVHAQGRRAVREDDVRATVTELLDAVRGQGRRAEIIGDLAAPLPAMMIGELLGFARGPLARPAGVVGAHDRRWAAGPATSTTTASTRRWSSSRRRRSCTSEKQGCPADDVMTIWTKAEIDGEPLDGRARRLRLPAAPRRRRRDDPHRHRPHDARPRSTDPDQWASSAARRRPRPSPSRSSSATSPRSTTCAGWPPRTTRSAGGTVPAGHQVVLMYRSANRDPAHFDRSRALRRHPPPEPPHRVRVRHPLLPRRRAGPAGDPGLLRGAASAGWSRSAGARAPRRSRCRTPSSSA